MRRMLCMKTAFFAASFTKKYGRGLDLALNSNGAKMPKNNADGARGGGRALACGCNRLPPASHVPVKYRFLQKTYLKVILVCMTTNFQKLLSLGLRMTEIRFYSMQKGILVLQDLGYQVFKDSVIKGARQYRILEKDKRAIKKLLQMK